MTRPCTRLCRHRDELSGVIEFLLGYDARNITEQTISIKGGWPAQQIEALSTLMLVEPGDRTQPLRQFDGGQ